jgi:tetratricopeptide (TPR) repeat protein
VRTADNVVLWAQPLASPLDERIFTLQAEIANRVLDALRAGASERPAPIVLTRDMAAYREYQIGRWQLAHRTDEGVKGAIGAFERATSQDSSFAEAFAGLANAWAAYPNFWSRIDSSRNLLPSAIAAYQQSERAARHALRLNPGLTEARVALIQARFFRTLDPGPAIAGFDSAVQVAPSDAQLRQLYRTALSFAGRSAEALVQSARAVDLDPLQPVARTVFGVDLAFQGNVDSAIRILRRTAELNPAFAQAYMVLGTLLWQRGERAAGADSLGQFLRLRGYDPTRVALVTAALSGRGDRDTALATLDQLTRSEWEPELRLAGFYALLGSTDRALAVLEAARRRPVAELVFMRHQPFFAPLRGDPRFEALWPAPPQKATP